jgi:hypothetical protein
VCASAPSSARHYDGKFRYLVNDLLMFLPGLRPVCVGINKTGKQGPQLAEAVESGFRERQPHPVMFPAGLNSRLINGRIHDLPLEARRSSPRACSITAMSCLSISVVTTRQRFYRIAKWQKRFGLKINIAMMFLVDEMYRNRHKPFRVVIGKPIPWQTFDKSRTPRQWAVYVEDMVYQQAGPRGLLAE